MRLAVILLVMPVFAGELSKGERDQAMSHLHATRKQVLDLLQPLSDAQLKFKAAPERWSILECAEHITETEVMLRGLIQAAAKKAPVDDAKRESRKAQEADRMKGLITQMTDRSKRASAPGEIQPKGRYASKDAVVAAFKERRDETIKWVETTPDDLRGRFFKTGASSESDLYEMMFFISAHSERHLLQMKEVMAAAGFPKR